MTNTFKYCCAFAALSLTTGFVAHADCTPIVSVPYTISQSGSYCVTADLSVAISIGAAISVNASDVDIDFQGHQIINTTTTSTLTAGVLLNADQASINNVTVHNGYLYWFGYGVTNTGFVATTQASNLTVDHMEIRNSNGQGIYLRGTNLRVTNSKISGVFGRPHANGILLDYLPGPNRAAPNRAVIQGNTVSGVRAAATTPEGAAAAGYATSIFVTGFPDVLIRDNAVYGVLVPKTAQDGAHATAIGVRQMFNSDRIGGLIVQDNIVQNNAMYVKASKPNTSTGIWVIYPGDHAIVTGSSISGMDIGINAGTEYPDTPPVLLLNSTITGATTPIIGGVTLP